MGVSYAGLVLFLTLSPAPWATRGAQIPFGVLNPATWLMPSTWTSGSSFEFAMNVMMFVPVGVLAARMGARWGLTAPLLLTLGIEVLQISMPNRISDPRDLVANAVGGVIGLGFALAVGWVTRSLAPAAAPAVR